MALYVISPQGRESPFAETTVRAAPGTPDAVAGFFARRRYGPRASAARVSGPRGGSGVFQACVPRPAGGHTNLGGTYTVTETTAEGRTPAREPYSARETSGWGQSGEPWTDPWSVVFALYGESGETQVVPYSTTTDPEQAQTLARILNAHWRYGDTASAPGKGLSLEAWMLRALRSQERQMRRGPGARR